MPVPDAGIRALLDRLAKARDRAIERALSWSCRRRGHFRKSPLGSDHFRFYPDNGHPAGQPACLKRAKLGSRHDAISKFKLVERSFLLV
jgi:hypothetical protein